MNQRLLTFIALFSVTISGIGVDLYGPSLPAIAQYFHVNATLAKMTISIFFIGFAFGQFFFGILSDIYGRKKILFFGTLLFMIASLASANAPDIGMLLILRAVQGFGAAACSAISKTLFADTLEGKQLAISMSYLNVAWALGPIVGPVIGGYLQFYFRWQANFYFYAIYSGILTLCVLFFLKETHHKRIPLDLNTLLRHFKTALTHKIFLGGIIVLGLGYAMIIVFNVTGPFLVQVVLGYNAVVYGHLALFMGMAFFLGTIINRILLTQISTKRTIRLGILISLLATMALLFIAYEFRLNLYNFAIPFFVILAGVGLVYPNIMANCMALFPKSRGIASAIMGMSFSLITGLAAAGVGFLKGGSLMPTAWTMVFFIVTILAIYWLMITQKNDSSSL